MYIDIHCMYLNTQMNYCNGIIIIMISYISFSCFIWFFCLIQKQKIRSAKHTVDLHVIRQPLCLIRKLQWTCTCTISPVAIFINLPSLVDCELSFKSSLFYNVVAAKNKHLLIWQPWLSFSLAHFFCRLISYTFLFTCATMHKTCLQAIW